MRRAVNGSSSDALRFVRVALGDEPAWLVGGAPRDRALGRETYDLDVVVEGSTEAAARAIARVAGSVRGSDRIADDSAARGSASGGGMAQAGASGDGAACFELSEEFSGWRVVARDHSWQVDVQPLRGGSLAADLAMRDFTVGAIAEPVVGGDPIDPLGGLADLAARRLRMANASAFTDDPLRVLRLIRLALDLGFEAEPDTVRAARAAAPELNDVSGERVFMELRRILASERALEGLRLMDTLGAIAAVVPELEALRGVRQSRYHHRDVHGHTLEVLEQAIALQADPGAVLQDTELAEPVAALLAEPLADELTRGEALRWGALLHDIAKPLTAGLAPESGGAPKITFIGHDVRGAEMAREVLGRLRTSERLRAHVAALVRHHLRLGFLVHDPQPLARRTVFDYLQSTTPVEVDVTLLSIADRLATRGDRAQEAIAAHMRLARGMLADALDWRAVGGPPEPLWRGDALAAALGIAPGPLLGELLRELAAAQYAGEILTRQQGLDRARRLLRDGAIDRGV